jgi:hypothetical protein
MVDKVTKTKLETQDEEIETPEASNLNDMLQELRILQQGAQVLTAFLVVLPFNQSFSTITYFEKWVFTATFLCSITSLIFFSAPAAQHRLTRPLIHRNLFKTLSTRMIIIGLVFLSLALILVTHLVVAQVINSDVSIYITAIVTILILLIWWVFPLTYKKRLE